MSFWSTIGDIGAGIISEPLNVLGVNVGQNKLFSSNTAYQEVSGIQSTVANIGISAIKGSGTSSGNADITTQVGNAITTLFGGLASELGTSAGKAAGSVVGTKLNWSLSSIFSKYGTIVIVLLFGIFILIFIRVSRRRRKRR